MPSLLFQEGPNKTGTSYALDCGAGIGRITKRLLLPLFGVVDMVDVTEDFLVKAKTYLGEEGKRVRNFFCCGLQDFSPEPHSYDVIWIQWVIGEHPAPLLCLPARLSPQRLGFPRPWELRLWCCCRGRPAGIPRILPALARTPPTRFTCFHVLFQLNTCCDPFGDRFCC